MSTTILTDTAKEAVDDAIATALGDVYDCNRVWDAWSYGTMGPDDFSLVAEDSDRLREITDAAIQAILQSPEVQARMEAYAAAKVREALELAAQTCENQGRATTTLDGESFYIALGQAARAIRALIPPLPGPVEPTT